MKRVITLFMMSLALATSLYAQVAFIPKVGASWAGISTNDEFYNQLAIDYGYKTGLIIGIAVWIPLGGDRVSVQPELLFHQKGYTLKYGDGHMSGSYKYTLNYLEMPVLASVHFGKFYIETGPYFGFGVEGKYQGRYTYLGQSTDYGGEIEFNEKPDNYGGTTLFVNPFDFGILLGAGVKVSVIVIGLRFGLGLTDIFFDDFNPETRNRSLQLTVGFPVGGRN